MSRVIDYFIVAALVLCVTLGVLQVVGQIAPGWDVAYVPALSFLLALEAACSTHWLRPRGGRHSLPAPWYVLRAVEFMALFMLLRGLLAWLRGPDFVIAYDDFYGGIDDELLALVLLAGLAWLLSWQFTRTLLDLEPADTELEREALLQLESTRTDAWQALLMLILLTGVALVLAASLVGAALAGFAHIIAYFALGTFLLSKTRLAKLHAGWQGAQLAVPPQLGRRWLLLSLALISGLMLLAVILPTHYSLNLLATIRYLISLVLALAQIIVFIFVGVVAFILSLFFPQIEPPAPPPGLPPLRPDTPAPALTVPPPLSDFVQSLIFWVLFSGVVIYLLRQYLRRNPQLPDALRRVPGWSWLARWWRRLQMWLSGLRTQLSELVAAQRAARALTHTRSATAPPRKPGTRSRAPRQRVQFYYAALLRRSAARGWPRAPSQSPREYLRDLRQRLPEAEVELIGLTDEFEEARYSPHDITAQQVTAAQRYWRAIKRWLRR